MTYLIMLQVINNMLSIRRTTLVDIDKIDNIFNIAREFMRSYGNVNQWNGVYPNHDDVLNDIKNNNAYSVINDGEVVGYFAFIIGEEKTYNYIENGKWLNDHPYGTIHRIASNNNVHGVFSVVLDYCLEKMDNVRIDTHQDNIVMRHVIEKHNFDYCGIIYVEDGSPRLAYQLCKEY